MVPLVLGLSLLASAPARPELSRHEQDTLARVFAPMFVFHADEQYFPISPLFPARLRDISLSAAGGREIAERMGTVEQRTAAYGALTLEEKRAVATVTYRVVERPHGGHRDVILEYWCHYVFNRYRVRGGLIPFTIGADHQQDLEAVYIVLEPRRGDARVDVDEDLRDRFTIRSVVADAHAGVVPANRYDVAPGQVLTPPVHVLVEFGSHAMAPDVDRDGRFTPGVDVSQRTKVIWGVRDGGRTWARDTSADTPRRDPLTSVALCGPAAVFDEAEPLCVPYALERANDVQAWFTGLEVSARQRRSLIGTVPVLTQWVGDTDQTQLLFPVSAPGQSHVTSVLRRPATAERGILLGVTTQHGEPATLVGARYLFPTPSLVIPDVLVEGAVVLRDPLAPSVRGMVQARYPLDVVSTLVAAYEWRADSRGALAAPDVLVGMEVRAGRFRIRPGYRVNARSWDGLVSVILR